MRKLIYFPQAAEKSDIIKKISGDNFSSFVQKAWDLRIADFMSECEDYIMSNMVVATGSYEVVFTCKGVKVVIYYDMHKMTSGEVFVLTVNGMVGEVALPEVACDKIREIIKSNIL